MMQSRSQHVHERSCFVAERMLAGGKAIFSRLNHACVMIHFWETGRDALECGLFSPCSRLSCDLFTLARLPVIQGGGDLLMLMIKHSRRTGDHLPGRRGFLAHHVPGGGIKRHKHIQAGFDRFCSRSPRSRERMITYRHTNAY